MYPPLETHQSRQKDIAFHEELDHGELSVFSTLDMLTNLKVPEHSITLVLITATCLGDALLPLHMCRLLSVVLNVSVLKASTQLPGDVDFLSFTKLANPCFGDFVICVVPRPTTTQACFLKAVIEAFFEVSLVYFDRNGDELTWGL